MSDEFSCVGFCRTCGFTHRLPFGKAREYAGKVIEEFKSLQRLDYLSPDADADPDFAFQKILLKAFTLHASKQFSLDRKSGVFLPCSYFEQAISES